MTELAVTPEPVAVRAGSAATALRVVPVAGLAAIAVQLAWREGGSIAARDWLVYAVISAGILAAAAVSGVAVPRWTAVAAGSLLALAAWDALSLRWSAAPSLARDEALLTALYAAALLVPVVTLRTLRERAFAAAAVAFALAGVAVATGVALAQAQRVDDVYFAGRLNFPIGYPNAQAAFFLVGVWPALALASLRGLPIVVRGAALAAAAGLGGGWLLAQSKGGALGLAAATALVFLVHRRRLRLAVPFAIAAGALAAAFTSLTSPYHESGGAQLAAIRHAGRVELAVTAAALAAGVVYAWLDRRLELGRRAIRAVGAATLAVVVVAAAGGCALFAVRVGDPADFFAAQWESFARPPGGTASATHFGALGSNRFDFWRVALDDFRDHPLAGVGSRGFRQSYLLARRSPETPARAHSLELDALGETGVVGLALLVAALVGAAAAFARRARSDAVALGALGAFTCWLVHASVDWTWSFPAIGIPLVALLGIAASRSGAAPLRRRHAVAVAAGACALGLGAFGLPWLSSHYVRAALSGRTDAGRLLDTARALDPLSLDPLLARAALAPTAELGIPPLREAVRMQPRLPDLWYALGHRQRLAGRDADAARSFRTALRLAPGDPAILRELDATR